MDFLLNFGKNLNSRITLGRMLPYILEFLDSPSLLLRQEAIKSISFLLKNVKEIDPQIQGIFGTYLLPILMRFITQQTEVSVKSTFAHEYPSIVLYVGKFSIIDIPEYMKIFNIFIKESDPIILDSLINGLDVLKGCSFSIYRHLLPILISYMNSKSIIFKSKIISFIQTHYSNLTSNEDKFKVKKMLNDFILGLLGIMHKEGNSKDMILSFFTFIHWFMSNNLYNDNSLYDIFQSIYILDSSLLNSNDSDINYLKELIYKDFPKDMRENLLIFDITSNSKPNQVSNSTLNPANIVLYTDVYQSCYDNPMHDDEFFKSFTDDFYDKFKNAPKFRNSLRVSNSRIIQLRPFFSGMNQIIALDSVGNIYSCSNTTSEQLFSIEGITSLLPHWEKSEMLISNDKGNFYTIDWLRLTTKKLKISFKGSILSLEDISPNVCVSISKQNEFALIDKRTQEITSKIDFNFSNKYSITPCCSSIWNQSTTSLIGFEESFVSAIDWRMPSFVFLKMIRNTPLDISVTGGDGSFSVVSHKSVSFYSPIKPEPVFEYGLSDSNLSFSYNFGNGNLIIGNDVYYISKTDKNIYILKDHHAHKMPYYSKESNNEKEFSLHQHLYPLTAVSNFKNTFATGDCNGFVHIWDAF